MSSMAAVEESEAPHLRLSHNNLSKRMALFEIYSKWFLFQTSLHRANGTFIQLSISFIMKKKRNHLAIVLLPFNSLPIILSAFRSPPAQTHFDLSNSVWLRTWLLFQKIWRCMWWHYILKFNGSPNTHCCLRSGSDSGTKRKKCAHNFIERQTPHKKNNEKRTLGKANECKWEWMCRVVGIEWVLQLIALFVWVLQPDTSPPSTMEIGNCNLDRSVRGYGRWSSGGIKLIH